MVMTMMMTEEMIILLLNELYKYSVRLFLYRNSSLV
jgi:hypothetical protein